MQSKNNKEVGKKVVADGLEIFRRLKDAEVFALSQVKGAIGLKAALLVEMEHLIPIVKMSLNDCRKLFPWKSIDYIKTMKIRPPQPVRFLMEALCVLKGIEPIEKIDRFNATIEIDYWEPSKKILTSKNLIAELKEFEEGKINVENLEVFQWRFMGNPDFERDVIERAFPPCTGLYDWLFAIEHFTVVSNLLKDKKNQYEQLELAKRRSLEDLTEIRRNLKFIAQEMKKSVQNNEGLVKKFPVEDQIVYLKIEGETSEESESEIESDSDYSEDLNYDLSHRLDIFCSK